MSVQLGWLDTNVFIHALYVRDLPHPRCVAILRAIASGQAEGWIDSLVVHELTYALLRRPQFSDRAAVGEYVRGFLLYDGLHAFDKDGLLEALAQWETQGSGFVDAWLAVVARRHGRPVCSANVRHFPATPNTFDSAVLPV